MFNLGEFKANSGKKLLWKIECDDLTVNDYDCFAKIVSSAITFKKVIGIPTGGLPFEQSLKKYVNPDGNYDYLIVDDVLTTGASMEEAIKILMVLILVLLYSVEL